jgi:hypothetical protein
MLEPCCGSKASRVDQTCQETKLLSRDYRGRLKARRLRFHYELCVRLHNHRFGITSENTMKRLIIAAAVTVIGLSCTTSLQAQTSTQTIKSATKNKKIKSSAAQPKPDAKHCDVGSGATHNAACY